MSSFLFVVLRNEPQSSFKAASTNFLITAKQATRVRHWKSRLKTFIFISTFQTSDT